MDVTQYLVYGVPAVAVVVAGVMIGASACGIYDAGKVKAGA